MPIQISILHSKEVAILTKIAVEERKQVQERREIFIHPWEIIILVIRQILLTISQTLLARDFKIILLTISRRQIYIWLKAHRRREIKVMPNRTTIMTNLTMKLIYHHI